jgi:hypothetical protein
MLLLVRITLLGNPETRVIKPTVIANSSSQPQFKGADSLATSIPYYVRALFMGLPAICFGLTIQPWLDLKRLIQTGGGDLRLLYTGAYMVRTGHGGLLYDFGAQNPVSFDISFPGPGGRSRDDCGPDPRFGSVQVSDHVAGNHISPLAALAIQRRFRLVFVRLFPLFTMGRGDRWNRRLLGVTSGHEFQF